MAKKDPSLSLEYILQKQQSEKLSGLSSTVKSQLGNIPPAGSGMPPENKILSELKKINTSLNVGLNKNIVKMTKAIENSTSTLAGFIKGSRKQVPPQTKNDLSQQDIEDKDYKTQELHLLEEIRDTLRIKEKRKEESELPTWLKILGAAVAAAVAALKSWAKLVRNLVDAFLPEKLKARISESFNKWFKGLLKDFKLAKTQISDFFKPVSDVFKSVADKLKKAFTFKEESYIGKIIKAFKNGFKYIGDTFNSAVKLVRAFSKLNFVSSITEFFGQISKFGKYFAKIGMRFARIFEPLAIIIGVFTTISKTIEGYKTKGIVGGIGGFLKGVVGSIILGFFDLVKDISAWVIGLFGFDKAKAFLNSFSFEKMYDDMIDKIVDSVNNLFTSIGDIFRNALKWLSNIEIPSVNFSIFGKKFEAGPWKPLAGFAPDEKPTEAPKAVTAEAIEVKPEQVVTPPATAAEAIYDRSAENEEGAMYPFATPSTNIVNAPTTITKSTQTNLMKVNVRNSDTSIKDYYRSRFAT
jgi:hypothetical protein